MRASDVIKRKVPETEPDERVFLFLQNRLIHSIGERSKIRYWVRTLEFSMDFSRTITDRLEEFFGYAAEGEAEIDRCSSDLDVSRAYCMKLCLKIDPRLKLSQKWLIENPQIKTLGDLYQKAMEFKARGTDECTVDELQKLYSEGVSPAYCTQEELNAELKIDKKKLRLLWGKKRSFEGKKNKESGENESSGNRNSKKAKKGSGWKDEVDVIKKNLAALSTTIRHLVESKTVTVSNEFEYADTDSVPESDVETTFTRTLKFFSDKVGASKEKYSVFLKASEGSWKSSNGCLDSGAETSAGILERHKRFCTKVKSVKPNSVHLKPWNSNRVMKPTHVGWMPVQIHYYENGKQKVYDFENLVKVFLVPENDMKIGNSEIDLLIGSPAIEKEKITPLDAVKSKVATQEKKHKSNRHEKGRSGRDRGRSRDRR